MVDAEGAKVNGSLEILHFVQYDTYKESKGGSPG